MLKNLIKRILPNRIIYNIHKAKSRIMQSRESKENRGQSAQNVFSEIYAKARWGGLVGEINSGTGSYGAAAEIYLKNINSFIKDNKISNVLDIGCGDFSIGRRLICDKYTGIDVVQAVVDRNNAEFLANNRHFICMDATGADKLPEADLCLVRQVLQHLSNEQAASILKKILRFEFAIITEHHPAESDFNSFNKDIVHGSGTRLSYGSGLYLDKPPFNLTAELLFEYPGDINATNIFERGPIRSFLVKRSN